MFYENLYPELEHQVFGEKNNMLWWVYNLDKFYQLLKTETRDIR